MLVLTVAVVVVVEAVDAVSCADAVCCASGASIADAAIAKPTLRDAGRFARRVAARDRRSCERFSERSQVSAQARSRRPSSGSARIAHPSSVNAVVRISNPSSRFSSSAAYEVS